MQVAVVLGPLQASAAPQDSSSQQAAADGLSTIESWFAHPKPAQDARSSQQLPPTDAPPSSPKRGLSPQTPPWLYPPASDPLVNKEDSLLAGGAPTPSQSGDPSPRFTCRPSATDEHENRGKSLQLDAQQTKVEQVLPASDLQYEEVDEFTCPSHEYNEDRSAGDAVQEEGPRQLDYNESFSFANDRASQEPAGRRLDSIEGSADYIDFNPLPAPVNIHYGPQCASTGPFTELPQQYFGGSSRGNDPSSNSVTWHDEAPADAPDALPNRSLVEAGQQWGPPTPRMDAEPWPPQPSDRHTLDSNREPPLTQLPPLAIQEPPSWDLKQGYDSRQEGPAAAYEAAYEVPDWESRVSSGTDAYQDTWNNPASPSYNNTPRGILPRSFSLPDFREMEMGGIFADGPYAMALPEERAWYDEPTAMQPGYGSPGWRAGEAPQSWESRAGGQDWNEYGWVEQARVARVIGGGYDVDGQDSWQQQPQPLGGAVYGRYELGAAAASPHSVQYDGRSQCPYSQQHSDILAYDDRQRFSDGRPYDDRQTFSDGLPYNGRQQYAGDRDYGPSPASLSGKGSSRAMTKGAVMGPGSDNNADSHLRELPPFERLDYRAVPTDERGSAWGAMDAAAGFNQAQPAYSSPGYRQGASDFEAPCPDYEQYEARQAWDGAGTTRWDAGAQLQQGMAGPSQTREAMRSPQEWQPPSMYPNQATGGEPRALESSRPPLEWNALMWRQHAYQQVPYQVQPAPGNELGSEPSNWPNPALRDSPGRPHAHQYPFGPDREDSGHGVPAMSSKYPQEPMYSYDGPPPQVGPQHVGEAVQPLPVSGPQAQSGYEQQEHPRAGSPALATIPEEDFGVQDAPAQERSSPTMFAQAGSPTEWASPAAPIAANDLSQGQDLQAQMPVSSCSPGNGHTTNRDAVEGGAMGKFTGSQNHAVQNNRPQNIGLQNIGLQSNGLQNHELQNRGVAEGGYSKVGAAAAGAAVAAGMSQLDGDTEGPPTGLQEQWGVAGPAADGNLATDNIQQDSRVHQQRGIEGLAPAEWDALPQQAGSSEPNVSIMEPAGRMSPTAAQDLPPWETGEQQQLSQQEGTGLRDMHPDGVGSTYGQQDGMGYHEIDVDQFGNTVAQQDRLGGNSAVVLQDATGRPEVYPGGVGGNTVQQDRTGHSEMYPDGVGGTTAQQHGPGYPEMYPDVIGGTTAQQDGTGHPEMYPDGVDSTLAQHHGAATYDNLATRKLILPEPPGAREWEVEQELAEADGLNSYPIRFPGMAGTEPPMPASHNEHADVDADRGSEGWPAAEGQADMLYPTTEVYSNEVEGYRNELSMPPGSELEGYRNAPEPYGEELILRPANEQMEEPERPGSPFGSIVHSAPMLDLAQGYGYAGSEAGQDGADSVANPGVTQVEPRLPPIMEAVEAAPLDRAWNLNLSAEAQGYAPPADMQPAMLAPQHDPSYQAEPPRMGGAYGYGYNEAGRQYDPEMLEAASVMSQPAYMPADVYNGQPEQEHRVAGAGVAGAAAGLVTADMAGMVHHAVAGHTNDYVAQDQYFTPGILPPASVYPPAAPAYPHIAQADAAYSMPQEPILAYAAPPMEDIAPAPSAAPQLDTAGGAPYAGGPLAQAGYAGTALAGSPTAYAAAPLMAAAPTAMYSVPAAIPAPMAVPMTATVPMHAAAPILPAAAVMAGSTPMATAAVPMAPAARMPFHPVMSPLLPVTGAAGAASAGAGAGGTAAGAASAAGGAALPLVLGGAAAGPLAVAAAANAAGRSNNPLVAAQQAAGTGARGTEPRGEDLGPPPPFYPDGTGANPAALTLRVDPLAPANYSAPSPFAAPSVQGSARSSHTVHTAHNMPSASMVAGGTASPLRLTESVLASHDVSAGSVTAPTSARVPVATGAAVIGAGAIISGRHPGQPQPALSPGPASLWSASSAVSGTTSTWASNSQQQCPGTARSATAALTGPVAADRLPTVGSMIPSVAPRPVTAPSVVSQHTVRSTHSAVMVGPLTAQTPRAASARSSHSSSQSSRQNPLAAWGPGIRHKAAASVHSSQGGSRRSSQQNLVAAFGPGIKHEAALSEASSKAPTMSPSAPVAQTTARSNAPSVRAASEVGSTRSAMSAAVIGALASARPHKASSPSASPRAAAPPAPWTSAPAAPTTHSRSAASPTPSVVSTPHSTTRRSITPASSPTSSQRIPGAALLAKPFSCGPGFEIQPASSTTSSVAGSVAGTIPPHSHAASINIPTLARGSIAGSIAPPSRAASAIISTSPRGSMAGSMLPYQRPRSLIIPASPSSTMSHTASTSPVMRFKHVKSPRPAQQHSSWREAAHAMAKAHPSSTTHSTSQPHPTSPQTPIRDLPAIRVLAPVVPQPSPPTSIRSAPESSAPRSRTPEKMRPEPMPSSSRRAKSLNITPVPNWFTRPSFSARATSPNTTSWRSAAHAGKKNIPGPSGSLSWRDEARSAPSTPTKSIQPSSSSKAIVMASTCEAPKIAKTSTPRMALEPIRPKSLTPLKSATPQSLSRSVTPHSSGKPPASPIPAPSTPTTKHRSRAPSPTKLSKSASYATPPYTMPVFIDQEVRGPRRRTKSLSVSATPNWGQSRAPTISGWGRAITPPRTPSSMSNWGQPSTPPRAAPVTGPGGRVLPIPQPLVPVLAPPPAFANGCTCTREAMCILCRSKASLGSAANVPSSLQWPPRIAYTPSAPPAKMQLRTQ